MTTGTARGAPSAPCFPDWWTSAGRATGWGPRRSSGTGGEGGGVRCRRRRSIVAYSMAPASPPRRPRPPLQRLQHAQDQVRGRVVGRDRLGAGQRTPPHDHDQQVLDGWRITAETPACRTMVPPDRGDEHPTSAEPAPRPGAGLMGRTVVDVVSQADQVDDAGAGQPGRPPPGRSGPSGVPRSKYSVCRVRQVVPRPEQPTIAFTYRVAAGHHHAPACPHLVAGPRFLVMAGDLVVAGPAPATHSRQPTNRTRRPPVPSPQLAARATAQEPPQLRLDGLTPPRGLALQRAQRAEVALGVEGAPRPPPRPAPGSARPQGRRRTRAPRGARRRPGRAGIAAPPARRTARRDGTRRPASAGNGRSRARRRSARPRPAPRRGPGRGPRRPSPPRSGR